MEETISTIIAELESLQSDLNAPHPQTLISKSTLLDLQTLLESAIKTDDLEDVDRLYEELSQKNLSPAALVREISAAVDSQSAHLSLLASKVYLSLLLSPNAPVFTLFNPISFLSLLHSVRRSLKHQPGPAEDRGKGSKSAAGRKRKGGGGRGKGGCNRVRNDDGDGDGDDREENLFDPRVFFSVLERLELVLGLVHLGRFPDCLKSLIQTVAEILVIALDMRSRPLNYAKLFDFCSRILSRLLRSEHGDQAATAAEVLKSLTPLIFLVKSQARSAALEFIKSRMITAAKDSDAIKKAVVNLPRYLAQKAPEKSEPRASAVESIMEIVRDMRYEDQLGFADYVVMMTQGKTNLRLLAVDIIPMLMMSVRNPFGVNSESGMKRSWGISCLEALIQRFSDASAVIRARALSNMAQLVAFLSSDDRSRSVLQKVIGFDPLEDQNPTGMNELLRKRCMDEKAAVRKASLLLITKLTAILGDAFDADLLKTVGMACSDPLVSIRKAAISALSEAFRRFKDRNVTAEWLHSVPRLISDNETSIQEECETLFLELVLDQVSKAGCSNLTLSEPVSSVSDVEAKGIESSFPKGLLGLLQEISNGEVTPWVRKICTSLGRKKRLKRDILIALQNIIKTSESLWLANSRPIKKWIAPAGAWFLLSEVSAFLSKAVEWEFLHHHWQLFDKLEGNVQIASPNVLGVGSEEVEGAVDSVAWAGDRVHLLQTISNVSVELPPEAAADLAHNLLKRLENFNMHSTEVSAHVKALRTLCIRKAQNQEEADVLVTKWVQQLLSKASRLLDMYIVQKSDANKENNFFTPPRSMSTKGQKSLSTCRFLPGAITACCTIGSLVTVCPSADLSAIIPVLHTIITSGSSDSKLNNLPVPTVSVKDSAPSLYIQAWLTMGKICLADGKLAKKYIPLFVQELEKSNHAALRNNIMVMMADFCVRYTALVDGYISRITKCLRDPCELVRRQTFILLSRLLQRDYVKWRGVLFLRFLISLVDDSDKIRQLADYLFGNILKVKAPLLAYNSFVEAIFVLNDCQIHGGPSDSRSSKTENRLFSIRGNDEMSRSKRMHIYVSLLKQMAPEHLLATFAKLCAEVLAAASDGMLNIEDITGRSVLQDSFQILSCKEIRIPSTRGSTCDQAEMDEEGGDGGGSAAKGRVITQAVRKSLVQNTIPIFIELKRLLESKNSPLTGSLMDCLRVLLKDYKDEIDDILVADKQLQKELLYDMQKYETTKAKTTAAEAVADLQQSASYRTPVAPEVLSRSHKKSGKKLQSNPKVASAMAEAAATAVARSVLKEVNRGVLSPPLRSISRPKLKPSMEKNAGEASLGGEVLQSIQRRQTFSSDEEN